MVKRRTGLDPLAYMGVEPSMPAQFVRESRNPTTSDYSGFNIGTVWIVRGTNAVWMLVDKADFIATWISFTANVGTLNTLTGDVGGIVPPTANNIDIFGAGPYVFTGTPGSSLLTLSDDGTVATTYDGDTGSAQPAASVLNIVGSTHVATTASGNTITITAEGTVAVEINTDSGDAFPSGGVLNLVGGNNITTTGAGDTVTINVDGTTDHAVQIGNATNGLSSIAVGTDGQVLIGATGADPAFATLTSTGGTILFTPGPNSLNLESGTSAVQIDTDSGTATVAAGVLNVIGGDNIATTGSGNTVEVAVSGTTQYAPQMGNAAGSLDDIGIMTDGELIIGATAGAPQLNTLTAGTGISITNGPGSITIDATGGSTGGVKVTTFNASGTWTKDPNAKMVRMVIYSGGGSGGSGARSNGSFSANGFITGAGGGAAFGYWDYTIDADYLGATENVVVGASSLGAAGVTTDDSDGGLGALPNFSTFGTTNVVVGGGDYTLTPGNGALPGFIAGNPSFGGLPGRSMLNFIGTVTDVIPPFSSGGGECTFSSGASSPLETRYPWGAATGGGGAGGLQNGVTSFPGARGGLLASLPFRNTIYGTAGTGGAIGVDGGDGVDGVNSNCPWKIAGTGGGGGGSHPTNPGSGGNGGFPGGGGGGGASSANGSVSGAGGDGAAGQVIIYEFLGF